MNATEIRLGNGRGSTVSLVCSLLCLLPGSLSGAEIAAGVSPGRTDQPSEVASICPTFSWREVPGVESYRLIAYEMTRGAANRAKPTLEKEVPGGALSWTPDMEDCLANGTDYVWFVRAEGEETLPGWSAGRMFRTPAAPDRTELAVALRRYLEDGGTLEALAGVASASEQHSLAASDARPWLAAAERVEYMATGPVVSPERLEREPEVRSTTETVTRTPLNNSGGGIFSTTAGSTSAALRGINTHLGEETVRGYLGVEAGGSDFDDIQFLDSSLTGDEVGVLGVSAGGSDNFGVVGVGFGLGSAGGRFFHGAGLNQVLLGTQSDGLACSGCVDAGDIGTGEVRAAQLASVRVVSVECNGSCSTTMDQICGAGFQAFAVDCAAMRSHSGFGVACGDSDTCLRNTLSAGGFLTFFCEDVSGWDANVYCLPD